MTSWPIAGPPYMCIMKACYAAAGSSRTGRGRQECTSVFDETSFDGENAGTENKTL